jgi:hypothetical protein
VSETETTMIHREISRKIRDRCRLDETPREELEEWFYESHKDFYGVKGRHFKSLSRDELVDWIVRHFTFVDHEELGPMWTFTDYGREVMEA